MKILQRSGPGAGEEIPLPQSGLVLGRGEEADLRVADRGASRRHCRLYWSEERLRLEDLKSKNGTLLNGLPVEAAEPALGDIIQIGAQAFQILGEEGEDPSATAVFFIQDEDRRETLSLPAVAAGSPYAETMGRLAAAFHMAGSLSKNLGLSDLLEQMLDVLIAHTPASRAAFILFEGEPAKPGLRFTREAGGRKPNRLTLGESMVNKAFRNGEALLYQNLGVDPTWPEVQGTFSLFYSAICAPLPAPSGTKGVIYFDTLGGEGTLQDQDLHLAAVAGALAGSALENEERIRGFREKAAGPLYDPRYGMVGKSKPMAAVFDLIRKVAPTASTVLIRGPSGTGKELVARAIHRNSPQRSGPFVAVNCGAIPQGLLESELFGYEKGAFTGADRRMPGRFEAASGGVLFLDEIAELPLESQVKILRALEEKTVTRLGGSKQTPVAVRLIAATNQELELAVSKGRFRRDLYYRLKVIVIDLPPLWERPEDIPLLVNHFLEMFRRDLGHGVTHVDAEAMDRLRKYPWPGNVRELRNTVERALVLSQSATLSEKDVSFLSAPRKDGGSEEEILPLREIEARHIRRVLESCGWNKTQAAKRLGIERSTLYDKLKLYGIEKED
ncbi:MAG: sigma 54-interacting transcriptional regulator [Planctomycetota bacterium]